MYFLIPRICDAKYFCRELCWVWLHLLPCLACLFYKRHCFVHLPIPEVKHVREVGYDLDSHLIVINRGSLRFTEQIIAPSNSFRRSTTAQAVEIFPCWSYFPSIPGTTHQSLSFSSPSPPSLLPLIHFFFPFKQGLSKQPRLALNLWPPCLNLSSPRVTDVQFHTQW